MSSYPTIPKNPHTILQHNFNRSIWHSLALDIGSRRPKPAQTSRVLFGLAEGLPDGSHHVPPKAVEDVALHQLVVAPAAQETEEARLTGLLAGRRHVALVPEVPEALEDPVVTLEGPEEAVPVGGEQAGHPVGLRGPVQQGPLGVGVRVGAQGGGGRGVVGFG